MIGIFMEVHGGSWSWDKKRTKSTVFSHLPTLKLGSGLEGRGEVRGGTREGGPGFRLLSCGIKVSEREKSARSKGLEDGVRPWLRSYCHLYL